ncbi:MAG: anhydro-N-acetylmuramic acid kinase [Magnetococcales bacterium]|nr:anhydro-N-acetylmuramic acid kinase [Magnetococcales bacterium]
MDGSMLAIGLISGTSADGIDGALIRTDGVGVPTLLAAVERSYPPEIRQEILSLYQPGPNEIDRMGRLDRQLGVLFADAAFAVCKKAGISPDLVDVIGSHGQTIRHRPPDFTLQIGNPAIIAARTGIKTIADFRQADLARGGEGAPLAPLFHQAVFSANGYSCGVLNLGGIANLTLLGTDAFTLIAGDTGPANSLIDLLAAQISDPDEGGRNYDHHGQGAALGEVDEKGLLWLMAHPYLARPFPKSTGREVFGREYLDQFLTQFPHLINRDGLATLTQFTADSVALACHRLFKKTDGCRLIICGGGGRNPTLLAMLGRNLPGVELIPSHELGMDSDSLESQFFAWFAVRTLKGLTSSLPGATGAKQAAVLGAIHH